MQACPLAVNGKIFQHSADGLPRAVSGFLAGRGSKSEIFLSTNRINKWIEPSSPCCALSSNLSVLCLCENILDLRYLIQCKGHRLNTPNQIVFLLHLDLFHWPFQPHNVVICKSSCWCVTQVTSSLANYQQVPDSSGGLSRSYTLLFVWDFFFSYK